MTAAERVGSRARIRDMGLKALLTIALLLGAAPAAAQLSSSVFGGLPRWADSALVAAGLGPRFSLSSTLNPAYDFGDFDGDGLVDFVVQIKDAGGLRYGLAIVHRIDRSVHIVGAGRPLGNGKDQLSWRASWGAESPGHVGRHGGFGRAVLFIADDGAPSGWLAWDGEGYVWIEGE
jgi:hypothetical protein